MRVVPLVIYVWFLVAFEPGSTVPVISEEDYHSGDGGHVEGGDGDPTVGSAAAAKKSLHHYCLFHVDLRCRDTCIDLGFMNGKCYKGICVCKGAERIAVRKLRLSGQMIVPYLEDVATSDKSPSTGGRDRDVVYNKKMLDDLVEASHRKYEPSSSSSSSSTTHRLRHHIRPETSKSTTATSIVEVTGDTTATSVLSESSSSVFNRSAHHVTRRQRLHHHQHYREHRHRHVVNDDDDDDDDDDENIIFELGHPQNLKGTIVGIAKEYDPQHLFSGEEEDDDDGTVTTGTSILPPVIIQVSDMNSDNGPTVVTGDVANLVAKLIE